MHNASGPLSEGNRRTYCTKTLRFFKVGGKTSSRKIFLAYSKYRLYEKPSPRNKVIGGARISLFLLYIYQEIMFVAANLNCVEFQH